MRVGVAGLGTIGTRHAGTLRGLTGIELAGVADPRVVDEVAPQLGVPGFRSLDEMLEGAGLDAVVICTPSGLHAEQGALAARHGVHVIAEKPMAITLDSADDVLSACGRHRVHLAILHQYRFNTPFVELKRLYDDGALGRLVFLNIAFNWRRSPEYYAKHGGWRGTWRMDGGGALMNQGAHAVDLARWLGGPVASVMAHMTNVEHQIEAEDSACVSLEFVRGGLGMIQVTTTAAENHPAEVRLQGTRAAAVVRGPSLTIESAGCGHAAAATAPPPRVTPHQVQFERIFSLLGQGSPPPVRGDDARETLAVTLAMYESARTGAAVACAPRTS